MNILSVIEENRNIEVENIKHIPLQSENISQFKWAGAVRGDNGKIYGIPTMATTVLEIDSETLGDVGYCTWGNIIQPKNQKGWSGGCTYDGLIYGFPRGSNQLLKVNYSKRYIEQIELNISYKEEHHYGGVLATNHCVYQPPKTADHILVINLDNYQVHTIPLKQQFTKKQFRYYCGVAHPNGYIYFFPGMDGCRIIKLNPLNEEVTYVGSRVKQCTVHSAAISVDGLIYAFSSYGKGILVFNPNTERLRVIHKEVNGCYTTILGKNGRIYALAGNGNYHYEYNPYVTKKKQLKRWECGGDKDIKAKCAGAALDSYGDIWGIPAIGERLIHFEFECSKVKLPPQILESNCFKTFY